jgi:hypothetical protein
MWHFRLVGWTVSHDKSKHFPDWILYGSTSNAICRKTSEVVSGTLQEPRDQFSTVEVLPFAIERVERACVLWCCVTISTWSKELQSNFVSKWVKVLPKVINYYKKRTEVIRCLVQRHLNDLNDFKRVGSRWRVTTEVDALPPAETSKQWRKCVSSSGKIVTLHCEC